MFLKTNLLKFKWFLLPIVLSTIVLSITLTKPFMGHHDFTNAFDGVIARNYLRHGFWELKFGQISTLVDTKDLQTQTSYFTHYPPLLPILIAISFSIFGVTEWAERLIPMIFSIMGVVMLFAISQKLFNLRVAIFSIIFFCLNPMFIYFGNMAVPEPIIVSLLLSSVYCYLRYVEKPILKNLGILNGVVFIGGLIGWPLFYLGLLLIVHSFIIKKFRKEIFLPFLVLCLTIFLMLLQAFILTGSFFGGGLLETLLSRLSATGLNFGGTDFSLINYLKQEVSVLQSYFTRILLFFSLIYVIFDFRKPFDLKKTTVYLLLLFGLGHPILFSRYTFIHDFLNIYLLPFLALSAGLGLEKLYQLLIKQRYAVWFRYGLIIIIFGVFVAERIPFTKALIETKMNKPGLEMARLINGLQKNSKEVAVVSPRFQEFYGVFTNFYVENPYAIINWESVFDPKNRESFKYLILIDEDIQEKSQYQSLVTAYQSAKINDKTIVYLHEKK